MDLKGHTFNWAHGERTTCAVCGITYISFMMYGSSCILEVVKEVAIERRRASPVNLERNADPYRNVSLPQRLPFRYGGILGSGWVGHASGSGRISTGGDSGERASSDRRARPETGQEKTRVEEAQEASHPAAKRLITRPLRVSLPEESPEELTVSIRLIQAIYNVFRYEHIPQNTEDGEMVNEFFTELARAGRV